MHFALLLTFHCTAQLYCQLSVNLVTDREGKEELHILAVGIVPPFQFTSPHTKSHKMQEMHCSALYWSVWNASFGPGRPPHISCMGWQWPWSRVNIATVFTKSWECCDIWLTTWNCAYANVLVFFFFYRWTLWGGAGLAQNNINTFELRYYIAGPFVFCF